MAQRASLRRSSRRRAWQALGPLLLGVTALLLGAAPATSRAAPVEIAVVAANNQPLAGAAVSVTVAGAPTRTDKAVSAMAQRDRSFQPGTLVVQTGTSVSFPNEDTVRHHVYSFSTINPFEIKLYVGTPARPVVFDKAGTAVLGCNIHDQMVGFIHVVDTPHFGVTDARGHVTLDLPPGNHRLRAWHPDLGAESAGVEATATVPPAAVGAAAGQSAAAAPAIAPIATVRLPIN